MVLGEFASGHVISEGARGSNVLPRVARWSRRYNVYIGGVLKWAVVSPRRRISKW